jgi:hypothetical protein
MDELKIKDKNYFGCWMLDAGCWILDAGCWILVFAVFYYL